MKFCGGEPRAVTAKLVMEGCSWNLNTYGEWYLEVCGPTFWGEFAGFFSIPKQLLRFKIVTCIVVFWRFHSFLLGRYLDVFCGDLSMTVYHARPYPFIHLLVTHFHWANRQTEIPTPPIEVTLDACNSSNYIHIIF